MQRRRKTVSPLPDDIIMEVLSRLPAEQVWNFRRVCRRWKALISSQYFAEKHLKANSSLMILAEGRNELLLVDKWQPPRKRARTRKLCLNFMPSDDSLLYYSILSYDGLIVLRGPAYDSSFIFNPITGDKVSIIRQIPGNEKVGVICGIFSHPQIKEYCILSGYFGKGPDVQFRILTLGSQPWRRDIKPRSSWLHKPSISGTPPVVIDEDATIYWMVGYRYNHQKHQFCDGPSCEELIMAFDIKAEEFIVTPHPGPTTIECCQMHRNMNIVKMDGRLSFVHSVNSIESVTIDIWILEDSATRFWIKTNSISIAQSLWGPRLWGDRHLLTRGALDELSRQGDLQAMAVGNGEILLKFSPGHRYEKFYTCNLELGNIRKYGRTYRAICAHTPSFVSLRNCRSEILIG